MMEPPDGQPPTLDLLVASLKQKNVSPKTLREFSDALEKYPKIRLHRPPSQVRLSSHKHPGPVLICLKGSRHREFVPQPSRCAGYIEKLLTPGYVATMPRSEMDEWLDLAGRTGMRGISDPLAIPRAAIHLTVVNQMLWPTDIRYREAFCTTIPTYILKIHEKIESISHEALDILVHEVYSDKKWRRAHWPPHCTMEITPLSFELHFTEEVQVRTYHVYIIARAANTKTGSCPVQSHQGPDYHGVSQHKPVA